MEAAIDTVKQFATTASEATRQEVIKSLTKLIFALESPSDTIHRYGHMVSSSYWPFKVLLQLTCTIESTNCHN